MRPKRGSCRISTSGGVRHRPGGSQSAAPASPVYTTSPCGSVNALAQISNSWVNRVARVAGSGSIHCPKGSSKKASARTRPIMAACSAVAVVTGIGAVVIRAMLAPHSERRLNGH